MNRRSITQTVNELVRLQAERTIIAEREKVLKGRLSVEGCGTYRGTAGTATVFERQSSARLDKRQLLKLLTAALGRDAALELIADATVAGTTSLQCKVTADAAEEAA